MPERTLQQLSADAIAHHQAGRLGEAEALYRQIVIQGSRFGEAARMPLANASFNLALCLSLRGEQEEALPHYRKAVQLRPDHARMHGNLGAALGALKRFSEAEASCRRALQLQPDYANAHYNLGNALKGQGRLEEAEAHLSQAAAMTPDDADTHLNLAMVLNELGRLDEAADHYRRVTELRPGLSAAHTDLGSALAAQDKAEAAAQSYARALALDPRNAEAHNNLGQLYADRGDWDQALNSFSQATAFRPDYADAHWNEALARLARGDFRGGWEKYEWRRRLDLYVERPLNAPMWAGESLAGLTILLHAEQGFGDTIQFVRYAPLVKAMGATVIVECQPQLVRLLETAPGVDGLIAFGDRLPEFDRHAPLPSLPGLMRTELQTIPADIPYLRADPALAEVWRERTAGEGLKAGLVWRGNPKHSRDRRRSIPAAAIAGVLTAPGVRWFSLQADAISEDERAAVFGAGLITDCGPLLTDWAETAALISTLDLVVTVDTAVAHLAGALGKPVWILLADAADWRWLLQRTDSPWYPTARLFRQTKAGDWDGVIEEVRGELALLSGDGTGDTR